jgi:hypothetical protein
VGYVRDHADSDCSGDERQGVMWLNRGRLVVITLAAAIVFARIRVKDKAALLAILVVISLYGLLFRRLRNSSIIF